MANVEFGTAKTVVILSIVAACFAILWPKIFYPMLTVISNKKVDSDNLNGCCDVIFETDVNAIKIMTEMCGTILSRQGDSDSRLPQTFHQGKLTKEVISTCKSEVMKACGIDIEKFLSKKENLGHSFKQMLDKIRSFNITICLRHHFGISPALLGAPRRMRIWGATPSKHLRQERPLHFRQEIIHPALREKGRAIPQSHIVPRATVEKEQPTRPIPMPGMRPPMGGAGHVVPSPKVGGTMSVVMPLYTIGIVIFFMYTVMKVFMKKTGGSDDFKDFRSDPEFRRIVFDEDYSNSFSARSNKNGVKSNDKEAAPQIWKSADDSTRLGWKERDTRDIEIDLLRKRLEDTEKAMERIVAQMENVPTELISKSHTNSAIKSRIMSAITGLLAEVDQQLNREGDTQTQYSTEQQNKKYVQQASGLEDKDSLNKKIDLSEKFNLTNTGVSSIKNGHAFGRRDWDEIDDEAKLKVNVVGLEMMAEYEGGQKWNKEATPQLGVRGHGRPATPIPPPDSPEPQNIFLEGSLPQQSQVLVTGSETEAFTLKSLNEPEPPVILSSKMTLSLISLDATQPEESNKQQQLISQIADVKSDDDNLGTADSTLFDVDSDLIDEGEYEAQEHEGIERENMSKEINEIAEDPSTNYTTATSERAEAVLAQEMEDTTADVSHLDILDITDEQEEIRREDDAQLWNGNVRENSHEPENN